MVKDIFSAYLDLRANDRSAFDYDELQAMLENEPGEKFDVFVRLAFEISERPFTPDQVTHLAKKIANLAVFTVEFNMTESNSTNIVPEFAVDDYEDALNDAYQAIL